MRVQLFTFRYSATLSGFDDEPLRLFIRDKEVVAFREHFFSVNEVPHLACILIWQDAVIAREDLESARAVSPVPRSRARSREDKPDPAAGLDERERALFNTLREWRAQKSREEGVPPYLVFTNRQFLEIVRKRPDSANALASVEGVGAGKVQRYGREVLALVAPAPAEEQPA